MKKLQVKMTKLELCKVIAKAWFPESYAENCGAKQGFIEEQMKGTKSGLLLTHEYALKVLEERKNKNG